MSDRYWANVGNEKDQILTAIVWVAISLSTGSLGIGEALRKSRRHQWFTRRYPNQRFDTWLAVGNAWVLYYAGFGLGAAWIWNNLSSDAVDFGIYVHILIAELLIQVTWPVLTLTYRFAKIGVAVLATGLVLQIGIMGPLVYLRTSYPLVLLTPITIWMTYMLVVLSGETIASHLEKRMPILDASNNNPPITDDFLDHRS